MKVILLENVQKVGKKFDTVQVADGFGLNYLIPQGLARNYSPTVEAEYESARVRNESELKAAAETTLKSVDALDEFKITFEEQANEQGQLFGAVRDIDIIEALKEQKQVTLDIDSLQLEHAIKAVGEHEVAVSLFNETRTLVVEVVASGK